MGVPLRIVRVCASLVGVATSLVVMEVRGAVGSGQKRRASLGDAGRWEQIQKAKETPTKKRSDKPTSVEAPWRWRHGRCRDSGVGAGGSGAGVSRGRARRREKSPPVAGSRTTSVSTTLSMATPTMSADPSLSKLAESTRTLTQPSVGGSAERGRLYEPRAAFAKGASRQKTKILSDDHARWMRSL